MASLTKTYKGDLTTSIAGVLYDRIKQIDDKEELDKTGASEEVKQEAVKLKKEDSNAIQVQNQALGEVVTRFFAPLQGKFLQTKSRIDNLSTKINLVAGGVADTQKLLINRNQLLEDKFDQMLTSIGSNSAITKQREAQANFDAMEKELEKGLDLSGTFAYEKVRTGSFGVLGKLLSFILGNGFTRRITAQIIKRLVPKGVRTRARLLRKSLLPVKKFARNLSRPGRQVVTRLLQPFSIFLGKKGLGLAGKAFARSAAKDLFRVAAVGRFLGKGFDPYRLTQITKNLAKTLSPADAAGLKKLGLLDFLYDKQANKVMLERILKDQALDATIEGGFQKAPRTIGKKMASTVAKRAAKDASRKTPKKLATTLSDGVFTRALTSPVVQRALIKKVGPEALEKIGVKAAAGGTKAGFPIVGTGYAVIEGLVRLALGDPKGMLLSFGSGIPALGWGFAIIDILRDIDRDAYTKHIEPNLPVPSDANIAAFFSDALGIGPEQYERGNVLGPLRGMGSDLSSITEILSVTKAFGDATGFSGPINSLISSSGLSGYSVPKSNYTFDVGASVSSVSIGRSAMEKEEQLSFVRRQKTIEEIEAEIRKEKSNEEGIETRRKDGLPEGNNQWWDFMDLFANPAAGEGGGNLLARVSRDKKKSGIPQSVLDANPHLDPTKPGDYIKLKRMQPPIDTAINSKTPMMGVGGGSTIEFYGQQGRDRSGEPGVDFSFQDYKNNYNLFPGYVLETGLLYGKGYGNVVVVRSTDPSNGNQFDALYAHFPDGGIAVKPGQQVGAGDLLGSVGFVSVDTPGVPQLQPNNAGNMSGWHTSVDFFEPGSAARYSNADKIINLITGASGSTPDGLLQRLKPSTTSGDTSSLNNIRANSNLATTMTDMVENGSSDRLLMQRESSRSLPIVILNNQVVNTSQTQIAMMSNNEQSGKFFEAYNLARHTV